MINESQINTVAINEMVKKLRENIIKHDPNDHESLRIVDECARNYSQVPILYKTSKKKPKKNWISHIFYKIYRLEF